jgi:glucoamylase
MPRDIPVGNGRLLVCFDSQYRIRDFYFPHVGQENHMSGNVSRIGVWVDGRFSWLGEGWKMDLRYLDNTLVTEVDLYNPKLELLMSCHDAVDFHESVYVKEITVENLSPKDREVRLFLANHFHISGNDIGDTAALCPQSGGIVHYKGARYFLVNGGTEYAEGLSGFAVGQTGVGNLEGTYRDAEDGVLSGNPIAQGSVDSVVSLHMKVPGTSRAKAYFWIAAGHDWPEVIRLDSIIREKRPEKMISRTSEYWRLWVLKESPSLGLFEDKVAKLYRRSLLVLRTQIDWNGGIVAANDSDVIHFNRDTYSYIWPRDGALVANALDRAGYPRIAQDFYSFVTRLVTDEGYLLHKYNPDGTLASSWHPWASNGKTQIPIQEDETALVLWALWHHFVHYRDMDFIKPLYRGFIKKAASFMCSYRDAETGLPEPSYDLWEERRGILSFTVAAVFGGITAASLFCSVFGEHDLADRYKKVAAEIRDGASQYLWREDLQRFCRMISRDDDGNLVVDPTRDSSVWGLQAFGLYPADDPRIVATMSDLKDTLWVTSQVGGMARYEGDYYHRVSTAYPGNPWFICTLWLADYLVEKAENEEQLQEACNLLNWVADHALPSGVLAEQVNPVSGEPLSVSPLTWSHATFVATTLKITRKIIKFRKIPELQWALGKDDPRHNWIEALFSDACDTIYGICRVG